MLHTRGSDERVLVHGSEIIIYPHVRSFGCFQRRVYAANALRCGVQFGLGPAVQETHGGVEATTVERYNSHDS